MDDTREDLSTVGELLREARTARGFSLADAERETKIRQKYLAALEEDDVSSLPGPLYVRGFLRKYASFLDVNPDELLRVYDAQSTPTRARIRERRGEPPPKPKGKDPNAISIQPLSPEKIDARVRYGVSYIALSLLAIPLIIIFYFIYSAYSGRGDPPIPPTTTVSVPTVTRLPTEIMGGMATPISAPSVVINSTLPVTGTAAITGTAIAGGPDETPSTAEGVSLQLEAINDAWVRITIDGKITFEGTLAKGTTRTWKGNEIARVRSGRSSSIIVIVNGQEKGRLRDPNSPDQQGEDNEIVEKEWNSKGEETVIQK